MKKYHPSQIAALIEQGQSNFPYRDPQSEPIIPPIEVSDEEEDALRTLGFTKIHEKALVGSLNSLGCCGDCEQWKFQQHFRLIAQILNVYDRSRDKRSIYPYSEVWGEQEFSERMLAKGFTIEKAQMTLESLKSFYPKARDAVENKLPSRLEHHKAWTNSINIQNPRRLVRNIYLFSADRLFLFNKATNFRQWLYQYQS